MQQKEHTVTGQTSIEVIYLSLNRTTRHEEDDSLFDDKLLPADKNKLMRLRTEIKRIKGGVVYPTGYENDRRRAVKQADELRLAGKPFPAYLEGVKLPWIDGICLQAL